MCGCEAWHLSLPLGMCAACALKLPAFVLDISFGKSPSKNYKSAVRWVKQFPFYDENNGSYHLTFFSSGEYAMFRQKIEALILIASEWKSLKILLNGESITPYHLICIKSEIDRVGRETNKTRWNDEATGFEG